MPSKSPTGQWVYSLRPSDAYMRQETRPSFRTDNGFLPDRPQAIIWTNAGLLSIGPSGTNFSKIGIKMQPFSCKRMSLKISSSKRRPFCLGVNVLMGRHHLPQHPVGHQCAASIRASSIRGNLIPLPHQSPQTPRQDRGYSQNISRPDGMLYTINEMKYYPFMRISKF